MIGTSVKNLNDKHRNELHASGLNDEFIESAKIYSANDGDITKILGWKPKECSWGTAMVFPYSNGYSRVKPDYPRHRNDGKPIKYESPIKTAIQSYYPPGFHDLLKSMDIVLFTEGEKKALAAMQAGYPCIGLPGVWGWQKKRLKDETGRAYGERCLIPDLDTIDWEGRNVVIVFDSDAATNLMVQHAEARLAAVLIDKSATVRVVRLPASGDEKVGLDDFLIAHGKEPLQKLIAEAKPAEKPPSPSTMDWAKVVIEDQFQCEDGKTLRHWREEFYAWNGRQYHKVHKGDLKAEVFKWLDKRRQNTKPRDVSDVIAAIAALTVINFNKDEPCWLNHTRYPQAKNILAVNNGLLDITELGGELRPLKHTPVFFSTVCLNYDFAPEIKCPGWIKFLNEVYDGDDELIRLLQQWFGLQLTLDTSYQKILFMVGPPRSGKGTVFRVLEHLIGKAACISPSLSSLGDAFGLSPLVGKRLCCFPDAHLSVRGNSTGVLEMLKSISGEDSQSVNRKFLTVIENTHLKTRIMLIVNELPRFNDASLALESRLLLLPSQRSFVGKENPNLTDELKKESSGILNWALRGLYDLRESKKFIVPAKSQELIDSYRRTMSPVRAFIDDECEIGPDESVRCDTLYKRWDSWCKGNGHKPGSSATFGEHLRVSCPYLDRRRVRDGSGGRCYLYNGISLVDG